MSSIEFDDESDFDAENTSIYSNASNITLGEPFRVITTEDVMSQMNEEMKNVSEVLDIPPTITRIIMNHYKWETQNIMDRFLASENDREAFFRDAGIWDPRNRDHSKNENFVVSECLICLDKKETTGLPCGHKFCRDCWNAYLTMKIGDYGEQSLPCPDSECTIIVGDSTVRRLVSDAKVLEKYNRLICNSFVTCRKNLCWCKSPGCNFVIDTYDCTITFATCKCGNQFCLECDEEMHAPISCSLLAKWRKEDSATQSYLSLNTKQCPHCRVSIEKNGGCPHMTCRNCKHQFCWKCLKDWSKHNSNYNCVNPEDHIKLRQNRTRHERLTYCWNRYLYNHQSLQDEIQRFDIAWERFEHRLMLKQSLTHIFRCRRFLMYSYAFVFYLKENNQVHILESALDNIEAKTDRVSVLLENYIDSKDNEDDFLAQEATIRCNVVDGAAHCDVLRQKWLDETEEGQAACSYEFRDDI